MSVSTLPALPASTQQVRFGRLETLQAAQHPVVDVQLRLMSWGTALIGKLSATGVQVLAL